MIENITLTNFRRFTRFSLKLRQGNILVGPNNTGKSSILDAFRILDACYRHTRKRNPSFLNIQDEGIFDGYEVPDSVLPFSLANITTNYNNDDAILEFRLSNKARGIVRLHPDRFTRFYIVSNGKRLNTSSKFRREFDFRAVIVPTLAPLEADEAYVLDETVRRNSTTRLASRNLRNIWLRESEAEFAKFSREVSDAWPGVELSRPERTPPPNPIVQLFYTENRMTREVQWSGFGFQAWLQILTHLRRGAGETTLIIDEPDIYLHPDLQKRLLRTIRNRFSQFIMATHSIEIINDAHASEVVSIGANARSGKRINTEDDYASLYRYLGSADNADFARIARVKRVIFVEGRDGKILRRLAGRLGFNHLADAQGPPVVQLGGFANSPRAAHAIWAFQQVLDLEIEGFCVFDRDYRCNEQIAHFLKEMEGTGITTMVFGRKEIENYLLLESALLKALLSRIRARKGSTEGATLADVRIWLQEATEETRFKVSSQREAHVLEYYREIRDGRSEANLLEQEKVSFEEIWRDLNTRLIYVPGKEVLSRFNEIVQRELKVSLTDVMIITQITRGDVDTELIEVLEALNRFSDLS